jgi:hypothetical protein
MPADSSRRDALEALLVGRHDRAITLCATADRRRRRNSTTSPNWDVGRHEPCSGTLNHTPSRLTNGTVCALDRRNPRQMMVRSSRATRRTENDRMATWDQFETAAPDLAARGRRLIERRGAGEALLATVRGEGLPRIHPINVAIVDGRLLAFLIVGSAKLGDLAADGRYALHAHQDPAEPHEFLVRGRAVEISDISLRAAAAAAWAFEVDDGYRLFEFTIAHAIFGERGDPDAWPPVYTSWRSAPAA